MLEALIAFIGAVVVVLLLPGLIALRDLKSRQEKGDQAREEYLTKRPPPD